MTAAEIAEVLAGRGIDVRRHGQDGYRARCPVHDDPSPSIDWRDNHEARRILLLCRAGCETRDVVEAWGLTMPDLFHDANDPRRREAPAPAKLPQESDLKRARDRLHSDTEMLAKLDRWRHWDDAGRLHKLGVGVNDRGWLTFPVRRGDGRLIGVTEYNPDPDRPSGRSKSYTTGERDLFPPPEFMREGDLWIVEGEGDAITAMGLGLNACGVPGASFWTGRRGVYLAKRLQGRVRVYVVPDCDEPGRAWAQRAVANLAAEGVDARLVDLDPTRADGWDLTALRHDAGSAETARKFVIDVARHAPRAKASTTTAKSDDGWPNAMEEAAFIGIARRIVEAFDPVTEADRAAILVQLLAAVGNIVGRDPHMILDGSRHTCALYVIVCGESSKARKGTSWARVAQIAERCDPTWYADRVVGGLSSGEGLIWEVRDPVYERVRKRDGATDEDSATEDSDGYVNKVIDPGIADKRLLVVETEFSQALRVMRRESNVLSAFLRNLWDRGAAGGMTKHARTRTTQAHVSIIGHITVEEIRREMAMIDLYNGFANRFLYVCARRSQRLPGGGAVDDMTLAEFAHEIATAVDWAGKAHEMTFDPDADQLWQAAYKGELANDARMGPFGAVTARSEPMVARLSMIYALLDGASIIRPQHFRAAIAVWHYCDASARYLFGPLAPGSKDAERLLTSLQEHPDGMTRTDISASLARNWSSEKITTALNYLRDHGFAKAEAGPPDALGKPGEVWKAA